MEILGYHGLVMLYMGALAVPALIVGGIVAYLISNETVQLVVWGVVFLLFFLPLSTLVVRNINTEVLLEDDDILEHYYQKDIMMYTHEGIIDGTVLKGEYENLQLTNVSYEIIEDKDKNGTYMKEFYTVKDKNPSLPNELEKYVIYIE